MKKIMIMVVAAAAMVFVGARDLMAREEGGGRGSGEGRGGEENHRHDDHRRDNNNNYYEYDGWVGEGEVDDTDGDDETVVVEPSPGDVFQDSAPAAAPIGAQVTTLPPGSKAKIVGGKQFYKSGDTWYKPYFGASGVYYEVVSPPGE